MHSGAPDLDADRIRALDRAWTDAAARRDLDGMMAVYDPEAQELLPGTPALVGREAIRRFYATVIQQLPRFSHHFEPEAVTVAQSGDLAVVRGSYRFTADTLQPEQMQVGKFVGVWGRREGDWRLLVNISNSDHQTPWRGAAT